MSVSSTISALPMSVLRVVGITSYHSNGTAVEDARAIAAHRSSQTTRLLDCSEDEITLDEIESI